MANTKNMDREARKQAKRDSRRALKQRQRKRWDEELDDSSQ